MQSYYLAPISYYSQLLRSGDFTIDTGCVYTKQTLHNRCLIDSASGVLALSIPVVKFHGHTPISEIRISDHGNWRHQHWNALVSSYRQTPYFDYYEDDFAPFYREKNWEFLVDYNRDLQNKVIELLGINSSSTGIDMHLPILQNDTKQKEYYQVFASRHGFLPDLSIIDILFNMGPESLLFI